MVSTIHLWINLFYSQRLGLLVQTLMKRSHRARARHTYSLDLLITDYIALGCLIANFSPIAIYRIYGIRVCFRALYNWYLKCAILCSGRFHACLIPVSWINSTVLSIVQIILHRSSLMTSLPIPPQPQIVIRQRRQIPSNHRRRRRHPEFRIADIYHTAGEMIINDILGSFHGQHRDHTHAHCCASCHRP